MQTATVHSLDGARDLRVPVQATPTLRLVENPAPAPVDAPLVPGRAASGFVGVAKIVMDVTATALLLLLI
ncbi:MAG: hypothetical protein Q8K72_12570, partial [Acidimicrobiales bacterium]|nr:hypothetical protein [Acidimicrobiales bacterium]